MQVHYNYVPSKVQNNNDITFGEWKQHPKFKRLKLSSKGWYKINEKVRGKDEYHWSEPRFAYRELGYQQIKYRMPDGKCVQLYVHRLVAELFVPNPNNLPVVHHCSNNSSDPSADNLEWVSYSENLRRAYEDGQRSDSTPVTVFHNELGEEMNFNTIKAAAKHFGVTTTSIKKRLDSGQQTIDGMYFKSSKNNEVR